MTTRPIVVGYDGSSGSRDALAWAVRTAQLCDLDVDVVHAWSAGILPAQIVTTVTPAPEWQQAAQQILAEALDHAKGIAGGVTVSGELAVGSPAAVLLEASHTAEMMVLGSRGHGGFVELLTGSTSVQVASHATCPTVVIRPGRDGAGGGQAGRVSRRPRRVTGLRGGARLRRRAGVLARCRAHRGVRMGRLLHERARTRRSHPPEMQQAETETADTRGRDTCRLAGEVPGRRHPDLGPADVAGGCAGRCVGRRRAPGGRDARPGRLPLSAAGLGQPRVLHHAHGPVAVVPAHPLNPGGMSPGARELSSRHGWTGA